MNRRTFLLGTAAVLMADRVAPAFAAQSSLADRARRKGLLFGCAVRGSSLIQDKGFASAVALDAGILVHEYELKRALLQPSADRMNFSSAEPVMRFAAEAGLQMRGTPLVWYKSNPKWLDGALVGSIAHKERILTDYVTDVAGRFAGRFHSWDVVNEPVEPNEGRRDGMRAGSPWFRTFGEEYIALAFQAARNADPKGLLFINDYNVEHTSRGNEARRKAILGLLERLKAKNVPVDGFGIQGHLKPYRDRFDERAYSRFLDELQAMGLKLMVTELDVTDREGPGDPDRRDADIAAVTRQFLDVSLDKSAMIGVLTWGLSDRYSWLTEDVSQKRPDGQVTRGLPLDADLSRKPMWNEIAAAFDAARPR